ncbi:oogenesis-related [Megalops cyprinoides]|uniref:oogenesis-related n=1 Tax=Megalops cyprinoides TaxID=118141 RepID=UPI0018639FD5|nr:oogenesis-related [Megalops cyprinoides]
MATTCSYDIEPENLGNSEDKAVVKRDSVLSTVLCRLSQFWPVSFVMRSLRGLWWLLGFSRPEEALPASVGHDSPSARQCRTGKKRLRRVTRLVLAFLPSRLQSALGYPVCTSIGCAVSPDVRCSPTKPSGKGSKRKQADVDDDDEEEEEEYQQSWVEALTQELAEEDSQADPDYEPSSVGETDSEEYRSHNDTESDIEIQDGKDGKMIKDVTDVPAEA